MRFLRQILRDRSPHVAASSFDEDGVRRVDVRVPVRERLVHHLASARAVAVKQSELAVLRNELLTQQSWSASEGSLEANLANVSSVTWSFAGLHMRSGLLLEPQASNTHDLRDIGTIARSHRLGHECPDGFVFS